MKPEIWFVTGLWKIVIAGNIPYRTKEEFDMGRPANEFETTRIEVRVPVHVSDQLQRAAKLRGMTLTGYIIATAGEDARRTVEEAEVLRMAAEDQQRFAQALIEPPAPNARLRGAAKRHAELIAPR